MATVFHKVKSTKEIRDKIQGNKVFAVVETNLGEIEGINIIFEDEDGKYVNLFIDGQVSISNKH